MKNGKLKGVFVPHTHWDREWRYPIWKNRSLLVDFMKQLLDMIDNDPDYRCFVTDGQCVIIEDYLQICPEDEGRIKQAVETNRLAIGPWYTLPDLYPLDGECLIRNLLKGIRYCNKLGGHLGIGYNSFGWGQTAQFPQIYKGFGFEFTIAAKHVSKERAPYCEFWWQGPDGTKLLTSRLGKDCRANGFFQTYIPVRHGMEYLSDDFRFKWGQTGQVFHHANAEKAHQDYFRIDKAAGYHKEMLSGAFQAAFDAMGESLMHYERLILDGSDFTTPQPILTKMIQDANEQFDDIEFSMGTLEEYADKLLDHLKDNDNVPVVNGELRDGPACDCSANALSTRIPIKQLNKKVENYLIRRTEPLAALLFMKGHQYPAAWLDKAWTYLLQAHPHDSINGVTQDKTVDDTLYRLNQALEIAEVVYEKSIAALIKDMDLSEYNDEDILLLVHNPLPFEVQDILKVCIDTPKDDNIWEVQISDSTGQKLDSQFISRREMTCPVSDLETRPWPFYYDRHNVYIDSGQIPAGGYIVLKVVPRKHFQRQTQWWPQMRTSAGQNIAPNAYTLENDFLNIKVNPDGTLTLTDKQTDRTFQDIHYFEDTGDIGDYWAYYPPHHNQTHISKGGSARIWLEDNGQLSATICVEIKMMLPASGLLPEKLVIGQSCRSKEQTEITIVTRLTLKRSSRKLDIHTSVNNTAQDHRLRVMIPTEILTDYADSAGHFTVDHRTNIPPRDKDGQFFPEMQTLPQQMFVDVSDGDNGLAVVNNCLTEYQLLDDPQRTVALTLFRSVRNRICTEWRSTGSFPNQKGGQLLQTLEFDYSIYPHQGNWKQADVYSQALMLNAPPAAFQFSRGDAGDEPSVQSMFSIEPKTLQCSTLKKTEDRDSITLRLYNPGDETISGDILFFTKFKEAHVVNMNEQRIKPLAFDTVNGQDCIKLDIKSNEIITIEIVK